MGLLIVHMPDYLLCKKITFFQFIFLQDLLAFKLNKCFKRTICVSRSCVATININLLTLKRMVKFQINSLDPWRNNFFGKNRLQNIQVNLFKVKNKNHSWQRVPSPLILWRPPYITYHSLFFKFCPTFLLPQPLPLPLFLLPCFFGWMGDRATFDVILLNGIMDQQITSLAYIVPEGLCCVFFPLRCQELLSSTTCGLLLVLWFDITLTLEHTIHTGANTVTHYYTYKY